MQHEEFNAVLEHLIANIYATLGSKGDEYATVDRLHNFNQSAITNRCTQIEALSGMMVKHTTSIYDMIHDHAAGKRFSADKWDEKITDHLNYLILLKAIVVEEENDELKDDPLFDITVNVSGSDEPKTPSEIFAQVAHAAADNFRSRINQDQV